jgi:uncharacterized repeat protein (TIGR03803 family)
MQILKVIGVFVLWMTTTAVVSGQTFKTLHNFAGTSASEGADPMYGPLVQGLDGHLYGTTMQGGLTCTGAYCGTVFSISTGGSLSTIYRFCPNSGCLDGDTPEGGLALNIDGALYGMTDLGGSVGEGTLFRITTKGVIKTLDSFDGPDGGFPLTTLIRGSNGEFYGITNSGGTSAEGVLFESTSAGVINVLLNFGSTTVGFAQGDTGALILGTDGNYYGTAASGGSSAVGTVFRMKPAGAATVLHNFAGSDGNEPAGALAEGTDGNFYGTTRQGGAFGQGTVFKITPGGLFTKLYDFCAANGCPDGFDPVGGLIAGTDGDFYGTTLGGGTGSNPSGTIFRITSAGTLTTLHNFNGTDGSQPFGWLVQHTNGQFYGTTAYGGTNAQGTVYSLNVRLGAFVRTLPSHAAVGTSIKILGTNLTGTSAVSFNGVSTSPTTVTSTYLTVKVPAGATTGYVTVTTPAGQFTSNATFHVP